MKITTFLYDRARLIALLVVILLSAYMQFGVKACKLFTQVLVFSAVIYLIHEYWINYNFYKNLSESVTRDGDIPKPWTGEQEVFCDAIDRLGEVHREKYEDLKREKTDHEVFIDLIVHEMKTPLTAMQLMLENFNEEDTEKLNREIKRLDNQLTTALFYSRQDDVKNDYRLMPVYMKGFIHDVLDENADDLIASKISVTTKGLDQTVVTDPKWLTYIVSQIFRNAFSGKDYGISHIEIKLESQEKWCDLVITDNGVGISHHEIQRIFDKAYAGASRRFSKQSSGLGLYLSSKIADRLGLKLTVDSIEGQYTSFKIERLRKEMKDY